MKRILSLLLAILIILSIFASCEAENDVPERTDDDDIEDLEDEKDSDSNVDDKFESRFESNENETEGDSSNEGYLRNGSKITFGSYPQTKVTDSSLTSTLNSMAGTLPTSDNSQAWTSYGYYIEGRKERFMWYIDLTTGGEKYRGVYFTSYRPNFTTDKSYESYSYQGNNGYTTNTVYWFKYEPISWTILSEDTANGTALILCDMIIDSQQYNYAGSNNYAGSTIREWLNKTFYSTAFNKLERQIILTTTVDNSEESTGISSNIYACENTEDKIFLLSYQEVINSIYGFSSSSTTDSTTRQNKTTDYAQIQGVDTYGCWWLRSPLDIYPRCRARGADFYGNPNYVFDPSSTRIGVLPALQIQL